jgi:hypothetical protein
MLGHDHLSAKEKVVVVIAWVITALVFAGWIFLVLSTIVWAFG